MARLIDGRPGLLVSVRSAAEARAAVLGGATVVDVKEPARGPLGCADPLIWRAVRAAVPATIPVSVALGELRDWIDRPPPSAEDLAGIAFRKVGPAGLDDRDWQGAWDRLRDRAGPGPAWVAVAYLDWSRAAAPPPEFIRDSALSASDCAGLLLDTWDKRRPNPLPDADVLDALIAPIRRSGRFVALAGGLDQEAIVRLAPVCPDLFAVRGAACSGGDRQGSVNRGRVRDLVATIGAGSDGEIAGPMGAPTASGIPRGR